MFASGTKLETVITVAIGRGCSVFLLLAIGKIFHNTIYIDPQTRSFFILQLLMELFDSKAAKGSLK